MKTTFNIIHVNLQQGFLLAGTTIVGAFCIHTKKLFIKESPGYNWFKFYELPDELAGEKWGVIVVGHFSISAWDFATYSTKELSDFTDKI